MPRILQRTLTGGPISWVRRSARWLFCKHVRALAIAVVVSLLVTSLPVSSSKSQSATLKTTAHARQRQSLAVQLYGTVSKTVTSFGSWMASLIESESSSTSSTYQPVAAYITPAPPFIDAPSNLQVTAASSASINLSWTAPGGTVDHYVLERSENMQGPFLPIVNVTGATTKNDTSVTNLHAYLYRVRAVSNTGAISPPSNMALGTAISFQFQELDLQEIRAQHFHDVRTAINLVRPLANLAAESWDRGNLLGLEVQANDVNEMRTALDAALTALSIPVTAYEDPTLNVGANGTLIKATHIEQLQTRSTRGMSTSSGPIDFDSSTARLDPLNETGGGGENPLSRNFNWNLPLLSLPGRAGMDLGLTLSYNSLVWTKIGSNAVSFEEDNGFPGPGFRLGFPVIQPRYFNSEVGKQAYLLIGPDGSRTELRQVGTSNFYEAADSSHILLDENTMILRTTDGTQMDYAPHGGELKCTQIKDRNGNFITISYNPVGSINTVTDTLNRVITFNYVNGWLTSITQSWKQHLQTPVTHYWARFEYTHTTPIDFNFGSMTVHGAVDNSQITTLSKVTLADDSRFEFSYTSWGQVWKVTSLAADGSVLNYRTYDLPQTGTLAHNDCPRFTVRKDWAKYWNGDTDGTTSGSEEVATSTFIVPVSDSWTMPDNTAASGVRAQVTTPDGTLSKIYFVGAAGSDSGWKRGLPALVETHSGGQWKRKVMTTWTQDDETSPFVLNPRVKETNVYDPEGNRARTEITYESFDLGNGMSCHLPRDIFEYAANATTRLRSTRTSYNMTAAYKDRRILGLVSVRELFEGDVSGALKSKVSFFYDNDNGSTSIQGTDEPVQHDNTNFTASFVTGRANLSSVKRHNVVNGQSTTSRIKYNTAGAVVSSKDALEHEATISYADSFSDGTPRNTLAYPTKVIDPDTFETTSKYDFDFGAVTSQRTPKPNVTTNVLESQRPERVFTFDAIGRLQQITNSVNSASTRFEYPNTNRVDTYTTIEDGLGEAYSFSISDGMGRVIATAKVHPGSVGGFSGQKMIFDAMGRLIKTSNPTETSASGHPSQWNTNGDDALAGWFYTEQTYDWKGRPLVTTNQDGTTKTASYSGCGCAGGEVVTLIDEGTINAGASKKREQKVHKDVLGRAVKTEIFNWQGSSSIYATTVTTYNVRDQVEQIREYAGSQTSSTYQDTTLTYDGYGRLKTQHKPEQQAIPNNSASSDHTTFYYNLDDTVDYVIDARGVKKDFTHNDRHLITEITYDVSLILPPFDYVTATSPQSFSYDAAGNRTSMSDATGTTDYQYTALSQINSETRHFAGPFSSTAFTMTYGYNLGGDLKTLTLPSQFGTSLTYNYDVVGRLTGVTGSGYTYSDHSNPQQPVEVPLTNFLSNAVYRAWNDLKQMNTGTLSQTSFTYDETLQPASYTLTAGTSSYTWNYEYFADGRLRLASDLENDHFDKAYEYDHVGRMTEAFSGREARGLTPTSPVPDSPYRQTFTYNAFSRQVRETGRIWQLTMTGQTFSFTNNRRNDLIHDAEGNVISDAQGSHTFDAAGERTLATAGMLGGGETGNPETPGEERHLTYDADGQPVRSIIVSRNEVLVGEGPQTFISEGTETNYYLRSAVLGGFVVSELNSQGQKVKQYIYAGGERLVEHWTQPGTSSPLNSILWQHRNSLTDSWISVDSHSAFSFRTEVDAHGRETGLAPLTILPNEPPPPPTRSPSYLEIDGAPTIEAELGMQLYEDVYVNKVFGPGRGPSQGGYDRLRTIREHQLRLGGRFLFGLDRANAVSSGEYEEFPRDDVGVDLPKFIKKLTYFLRPQGTRPRKVGQGPQNQGRKPLDATKTEKLLTEDCVHFLNSILAELKDPHSYNFRTIFRKAKDQRPLYTRRMTAEEKKKALGGVHSRVGDPAFYIFIDEDTWNAGDGFILVHELFHGAANSGTGYNH